MRSSQWFFIAFVFLLLGIVSLKDANHEYNKWKEFSDKHLKLLEEAAIEEKIWSQQTVAALSKLDASAKMYWGDYRLLWEFSSLYLGIFFACLICGLIELKAEKRKRK